MSGLLWNVFHSVYITFGFFINDYRMNIIDNIDNIISVKGKSWWTNYYNPRAVWFYKPHQDNLIYGEHVLDEKYLCAILEGDWNWLEVKSLMNRWQ